MLFTFHCLEGIDSVNCAAYFTRYCVYCAIQNSYCIDLLYVALPAYINLHRLDLFMTMNSFLSAGADCSFF